MTRVIIGASSEALRVELASLLTTDPMFQVVGRFSIDNALAKSEDLQADVVVLDVESLADDAVTVAIESGGVPVSSALVILTDTTEKFLLVDALRSGVRAVLQREAKPKEIFSAIQASVAGLVVLHPDALDSVLPLAGEQPELDGSDQILTPREIEVLRLIADGLGNKEIASKLKISDHTVKFHISSIFHKLDASNRAEAVTIGIREGLIMV